MHYTHRYYALYPAEEFAACSTSQGLLQVAILGLALKSTFSDFVLEHLPITDQLRLVGVHPNSSPIQVHPSAHGPHPEESQKLTQVHQESITSAHTTAASTLHSATREDTQGPSEPLLRPSLTQSPADLYLAKMKLESRLKRALAYDFGFESPLVFIERFFECALSPAQRQQATARQWQADSMSMVHSLAILPFSQWFHPVLVAAGCLNWTKINMQKTCAKLGQKPPLFPETIAGSPWFHYVDPGVHLSSMEHITQAIDSELQFLLTEVAPAPTDGDPKTEAPETHQEVEAHPIH